MATIPSKHLPPQSSESMTKLFVGGARVPVSDLSTPGSTRRVRRRPRFSETAAEAHTSRLTNPAHPAVHAAENHRPSYAVAGRQQKLAGLPSPPCRRAALRRGPAIYISRNDHWSTQATVRRFDTEGTAKRLAS